MKMESNSELKLQSEYPGSSHLVYLLLVGFVFAAFSIVFIFFPRTTFSEVENRDLKTFPEFGQYSDKPTEYTMAISDWFSDSQPYRDHFMTLSMNLRDMMKFRFGNEAEAVSLAKMDENIDMAVGIDDLGEIVDNAGNPLADANAKVAGSGVIVAGSGENIRGMSAFGGSEKSGTQLAEVANFYHEQFPSQNIYVLVIPTAAEFYLPDKAKGHSRPQLPTLNNIKSLLNPGIKWIDAYSNIKAHTMENVYLRTDHHWSPLGAYYAAMALAKTAGVPFKSLDNYDKHVIHGYVGSMYRYSNDIAFKNNPEDFEYYTPRGVNYTTTYTTFKTNKNYQVISESAPYQGEFFHKFGDGSGNAYLTFMGGDQHLVKVKTNVNNNRKLLLIKDSYGNALPGYLFSSFNEVHVVDFRYFSKNMKKYVAENGITDIVISFNMFNACNSASMKKIRNYVTEPGGIHPAETADKPKDSAKQQDASKSKDAAKAKEQTKTKDQAKSKETKAKENTKPEKKEESSAPAPDHSPASEPTD